MVGFTREVEGLSGDPLRQSFWNNQRRIKNTSTKQSPHQCVKQKSKHSVAKGCITEVRFWKVLLE